MKWKGIFLFLAGACIILILNRGLEYTSSDDFCDSCHMHPHAMNKWRFSSHYDNKSGIKVHCVECHLPPDGVPHLTAKVTTGLRDIWGTLIYSSDDIDWDQKATRESANSHVYKKACLRCHQNLFPRELSKKGEDAHLYYDQNSEALRCINCHIDVGHYRAERLVQDLSDRIPEDLVIFEEAVVVDSFTNYIEKIPGTTVSFKMIAIPGGQFTMGSAESESFRKDDEGPAFQAKVNPFWMAKYEISWDEYEAYYKETHTEKGLLADSKTQYENLKVDGVTGPTAPYGNPGQGWGKGRRPAITMTHFAAQQYCQWLSEKTNKIYRLPTEAEWEYACRGGADGAYFFAGEPDDYSGNTFINNIFGPDTSEINSYVVYKLNSKNKTQLPGFVSENPFGLVNMLGNVREYCSDLYSPTIYSSHSSSGVVLNPKGPPTGDEHVIRGGSFRSDAADLRIARRDYTRFDSWMLTDPQIPKSKWWYSDCNDVGFRIVCEYKN